MKRTNNNTVKQEIHQAATNPTKKVKTESSSSTTTTPPSTATIINNNSSSSGANIVNNIINNNTINNNNNNTVKQESNDQTATTNPIKKVKTEPSSSTTTTPPTATIINSNSSPSSRANIFNNIINISNTTINNNNNNNRTIRIAYNPDEIELYLLWRSLTDSTDDTKEENWKKVQSTFIPSFSSSIHKQYISHLDELNNSSTNSIRIGLMCKNKTNVNIALKFELDGTEYAFMSTTLKPREDRLIRRLIHKTTKASQTIEVKRNQIVEGSSSSKANKASLSEKSLIEKLGTIKVKVFRIQLASEQSSSSSSSQNMIKTPDIKISEGMSKMKDLSIGFGTINNAQSFSQSGFVYKEEIKTVEFVYHTKLGYLFELRNAGIDISNL